MRDKYVITLPNSQRLGLRWDYRSGELMVGGFRHNNIFMRDVLSDYFDFSIKNIGAPHIVQRNKIRYYKTCNMNDWYSGIRKLQEHGLNPIPVQAFGRLVS